MTEQASFRDMIKYCNPKAKVFTADTVKRDVMESFVENRAALSEQLSVSQWKVLLQIDAYTDIVIQALECRVSLTLDMWNSPANQDFLGITGHFVDSNWKLQSLLLDFVHIKTRHTGENLANALIDSMSSLQLSSKVAFFAYTCS